MIGLLAIAGTLLATADFTPQAQLQAWQLVPADSARPGLLCSRPLSQGRVQTLARLDTAGGVLQGIAWHAEQGVVRRDLPDEAFWAILDGTGTGDWVEAEPGTLPTGLLARLESPPGQAFLCRSCEPVLAATTHVWNRTTSLTISRLEAAEHPAAERHGWSSDLSEFGLRSTAGQAGLLFAGANPCREGGGSCTLEFRDSASGARWKWTRSRGNETWLQLEASFPGNAWWSPQWDWDSLRADSPRDFQLLLRNWLDAELDVDVRKLLGPFEPVLAAPLSSWNARRLPGLDLSTLVAQLAEAAAPPSGFVLAEAPGMRLAIEPTGRRTLVLKGRP